MKPTTNKPYFQFDAGRFLADTMGYPSAHVGIYIRLMALYWESGHQLPAPDTLPRKLMITTDQEEEVLDEVLRTFFPNGRHEYLDGCLEHINEFSQKQREKAQARWEKNKGSIPRPSVSDGDF